jgi:hypothetical protein
MSSDAAIRAAHSRVAESVRLHRDPEVIEAARLDLEAVKFAKAVAKAEAKFPDSWPELRERLSLLLQPGGET